MISCQHQPSMESTLFNPTRPNRRRRFQENCPMYLSPNKKRCTMPKKTSINDLSAEILGSIFSFLPQVELVRSSRTCRAWHEASKDFALWKDLDLNGAKRLDTLCRQQNFPRILENKLSQCRSFHAEKYPSLDKETLCHLLERLAESKHLTSIAIAVNLSRGILPFSSFFGMCAGNFTHIDLPRSQVPNCVVSAILERHGKTLVSINLEFSAITEISLQLISREAKKLKHLGIAGCLSISSAGLKQFLNRDIPASITNLDLRWLMDTEALWVYSLLSKRFGMHLNLEGCDLISAGAVNALKKAFPDAIIKHKPQPSWSYRQCY